MDHLLLPRGASVSESERAHYVADVYDGGPFLIYPQRSRFKALYERIEPTGQYRSSERDLDATATREVEVLIQTWIVLGLLHEVFRSGASPADFIKNGHDGSPDYVTTIKLAGIVDRWIERNTGLAGTDEGNGLLEHLIKCIIAANSMLTALRRRAKLSDTVPWSVASVAETVECVVLETLERGTRNLPTMWEACYDSNEIATTMVENGRCPADIAKWRTSSGGFQTLYYLSKMEQPKIKDHSRCVGEVCAATQYDMSGQLGLHRCPRRDCGLLSVDEAALKVTFDEGCFGLLKVSGEDDPETLTIKVLSTRDHPSWIAFSHVWADGLGNPAARAFATVPIGPCG